MPVTRIALAVLLGAVLLVAPAGADEVRFGVHLGERSGAFLSVGDPPFPKAKPHHRPHSRPHPGPRPKPHTKPSVRSTLPRTGVGPTPGWIGPPPAAIELRRRFDFDKTRDKPRRRPRRRDLRRPFLFPHLHHDDDFDEEDEPEIIVVPTPSPAPPEKEPEEESAEPAPPPDPRGPVTLPVRGARAEPAYTVGAPLPEEVPHVTLDWRRYGLPEPPAGLVYARVGGDVLLIDPVTRRVERRVDPGELEHAPAG